MDNSTSLHKNQTKCNSVKIIIINKITYLENFIFTIFEEHLFLFYMTLRNRIQETTFKWNVPQLFLLEWVP